MKQPSSSRSTRRRPAFASDRARYAAVRNRDARAEGHFYYAVTTTGIYCRPTCAARRARREHIEFYSTPDSAERAGFRPCRRCRPKEASDRARQQKIVETARQLLDSTNDAPKLEELAARVKLSPYHLQRLFKQYLGLTPREYAAAARLERAASALRDGASVTTAIHRAGYSSSSRFYEAHSEALGMLPSGLRRLGEGIEIRATVRRCSLGRVLVAATPRGVCAVLLGDSAAELTAELSRRFPRALLKPSDAALGRLAARVVALIDGSTLSPLLPLDLVGTAFQQRVWRALGQVPRGQTSTYGELAQRIGAPGAVRAVGTACGKNPVAVVVPCHRVVRGNGALGGYRWGIWRKKKLLERER